jgi:asparagine synthase (glutamine-hydrolysing)
MCGIFAVLNSETIPDDILKREFEKGQRRGPEFSKLDRFLKSTVGFHRLAINGLNSVSNQPIIIDNIILVCNGEIYNYRELYNTINVSSSTQSDCEIIIHLYIKYGIEQTLNMLDGYFSFILLDQRDINNEATNYIYIARDTFGVRPLYSLVNKNNYNNDSNDNDSNDNQLHKLYGFASELKCLEYFYNSNPEYYNIKQFEPATYSIFKIDTKHDSNLWKPYIENKKYFIPSFPYLRLLNNSTEDYYEFYNGIAYYLKSAVIKRCRTTERPVACLLSGGLDSSLIAALVANYFRKQDKQIETYSIGLSQSEDIKYAKIVADYIGSKHTEIIVTEDDMFNAIPEVIEVLESYDTTTIRASLGNYLIGKYIAANSEAKVIFNGDGSDELFGGYLYMNKCPDDIEFDKETRRLLKDIYLFDVLRSDKSISSNGLEPRTPFLDKTFVNYVLSIPPYFRNHNNKKYDEKYLLRNAFNKSCFVDSLSRQLLPDEILFRRKEAFSDGVSSHGRSLFQILQEKCAEKLNLEANIETEKKYYKQIFDELYPNCSNILPYFWMPKYIESNDPSARTLTIY